MSILSSHAGSSPALTTNNLKNQNDERKTNSIKRMRGSLRMG
jgi:hypothetical protein